jgi:hypothetical protein
MTLAATAFAWGVFQQPASHDQQNPECGLERAVEVVVLRELVEGAMQSVWPSKVVPNLLGHVQPTAHHHKVVFLWNIAPDHPLPNRIPQFRAEQANHDVEDAVINTANPSKTIRVHNQLQRRGDH